MGELADPIEQVKLSCVRDDDGMSAADCLEGGFSGLVSVSVCAHGRIRGSMTMSH